MGKIILATVGIIGCLALVAAGVFVIWFGLGTIGGGSTSVGETSVQYVSISGDGRISLAIWSDGVSGRNHAEAGLFGSSVEGSFSSPDGKRVEWTWKSPRERGGEFQLNGTRYDLANGTLFLVSTKGGQVQVTQLDADLSKIKPDRQGFEAFAREQPKVAQFVAEAAGK